MLDRCKATTPLAAEAASVVSLIRWGVAHWWVCRSVNGRSSSSHGEYKGLDRPRRWADRVAVVKIGTWLEAVAVLTAVWSKTWD